MNKNYSVSKVMDTVFKVVRYKDGRHKERGSLIVDGMEGRVRDPGLCEFTVRDRGLLEFRKNGRVVVGEEYSPFTQSFRIGGSEAVYGLGMHQGSPLNRRGRVVRMAQGNFCFFSVSAPFITTTGGYAILLDNYSFMSVGIDKPCLDDTTEDLDTDALLPGTINVFAQDGDNFVYYVILEDRIDDQIKTYRELTGMAPMYPKWAYGYMQSREHYRSQGQILEVAREFRERKVPIDCIIQDWNYWGAHGWNALKWDEGAYPDPKGMIAEIKAMNMALMLSVWPSFGADTEIARKLEETGGILERPGRKGERFGRVHDPLNERAQDIIWESMKESFFDIGIDAWWLDSTEPGFELDSSLTLLECGPCALGDCRDYLNCYALNVSKNIYRKQREATDQKRVFILTRSGFAGQQKYASSTWTGDISASWETFKAQIPALLSFSLSGIPYSTTDIGAFLTGGFEGGNQNPEYRELYTRWFWFGAFSPLFRSHGTGTEREPWFFGDECFDSMKKCLALRYRLMPYIYALARRVYEDGYTIMRPLAMDFPLDAEVYGIEDGYMFGESLLVYIVTDYMARRRRVYLPKAPRWHDFFTGRSHEGGQYIEIDTPTDMTPLFVRGGSILLTGPDIEYTGQDDGSRLDINVYDGADASAYCYRDDGDNYAYESGRFLKIPFAWDDASGTLAILPAEGDADSFAPGAELRVYLNGVFKEQTAYKGGEMAIKLR